MKNKIWSALEQQLLDEISAKIDSLDYKKVSEEEFQVIKGRLERAIVSNRLEGHYQSDLEKAVDDLLLKERLPIELLQKISLESVYRKLELGIL